MIDYSFLISWGHSYRIRRDKWVLTFCFLPQLDWRLGSVPNRMVFASCYQYQLLFELITKCHNSIRFCARQATCKRSTGFCLHLAYMFLHYLNSNRLCTSYITMQCVIEMHHYIKVVAIFFPYREQVSLCGRQLLTMNHDGS